jgi:pyruvate/2-oxoacid:ferredoxin oxidoreductase alpha subunit
MRRRMPAVGNPFAQSGGEIMTRSTIETQEQVITGNQAAAWGAFLARRQVVAAYPITPQTSVIETLAELTSRSPGRCRFINVESEHSAMAACVSASTAGARVFTATSSQGLLLMHELLHWAGGGRLPVVMVNVNRAPAPGWNIWGDQNDSLSQRDTGWVQLYCESAQEVLDTVIQAYLLAEELLVPVMVIEDAFVLSHTAESVQIPSQELVDRFLPELRFAPYSLNVDSPAAFGGLLNMDYYQEVRKKLHDSLKAALPVSVRINSEWEALTGRHYPMLDPYRCEDADLVLMTMATPSSTSIEVVDTFRNRGIRAGRIKVKMFRPFLAAELRELLRGKSRVVVLDRNCSYGSDGILFTELKSALYPLPEVERPQLHGYIAGLGGRDITPVLLHTMMDQALRNDPPNESIWIK